MSDKKYTAVEAARAVLAKASELYQASTLAKGELAKGDWAKIHSKLKKEGYSEESADKIDGAIKAKMGKSEEQANPDEQQDAQLGEQVEDAVHQHEATSEHPGQHADGSQMKGHIKLAKFMGRMEHKKGQKSNEMDKGETGHEKGVATQSTPFKPGTSMSGESVRAGNPGAAKQDSVGRQMQNEQIKPKLWEPPPFKKP